MKGLTTFALSVVALGFVCAGLGNTSCFSNSDGDDDGDDDGSGDAGSHGIVCNADGGDEGEGGSSVVYTGLVGETCVAPPGAVPEPQCDDAWQGPPDKAGFESLCNTTPTTCPLSACPVTTAATSCEPLTTNPTEGPWSFRMRRLIVVSPGSLASETVQNTVVTSGVDMNEIACGEVGTGAFSWLLTIDPGNDAGVAPSIKTGGAPPCDIPNPTTGVPTGWSCNPFTTGYCFVNKLVGTLPVAPVTAPAHQNCDGTWATKQGDIGTVNIPIYYQNSIIVLPIRGGTMDGVTVSADGNCIGTFNPYALSSTCADHYDECSKWKNDGSITGFITLEDADKVKVDLLQESLCVILTGTAGVKDSTGYGYCARDASNNIIAPGDYCSTGGNNGIGTPAVDGGSCHDSFWLSATFAASAVKLNDGQTSGPNGGPNVDCLGNVNGTDAGSIVDSGSTVDASTGTDSGSGDAGIITDASAD